MWGTYLAFSNVTFPQATNWTQALWEDSSVVKEFTVVLSYRDLSQGIQDRIKFTHKNMYDG